MCVFGEKCTHFVGIALIVSCGSCGSSMDKQMIQMDGTSLEPCPAMVFPKSIFDAWVLV